MKVKNEMRFAFVFLIIAIALALILEVVFDEGIVGLILASFFVNIGLTYLVGIRMVSLNWLLVKKDPSIIKLLDMDYKELKKEYIRLKKEAETDG